MQETCNLPFELTSESVNSWLKTIEEKTHSEKVNLVNGILNDLLKLETQALDLLTVLEPLTPLIMTLTKLLEANSVSEKSPPEKAIKWLAVSIQLVKKFCFLYAKLAADFGLDNSKRRLSLFRAVLFLSLLIKWDVMLYEAPDQSLWKKLSELYLLAQSLDCVTFEINDTIAGFIYQPTIQAVIKHILAFYSSHVYQCPRQEINEIFSATAQWTSQLRLDNEQPDFVLASWDSKATLPVVSACAANAENSEIPLNTFDLIDYFDSNQDKLMRYRNCSMAISRLTAYQEIRRSVSPSNPKKCGLIIGVGQTAKFLNILISRYRIMELSGAIEERNKIGPLELVPIESGIKAMASLSTKLLSDDKSFSATQLNVYDTDNSNFWVAKIGNLDCSLDEPVILVEDGQQPCFAVIRHIRLEKAIKLKNLLLEKIMGSVYPIEIDDVQAFIIIRASTQKIELFLPPDLLFRNQTVLSPAKGIINGSLKIERFIEISRHFARYEISMS